MSTYSHVRQQVKHAAIDRLDELFEATRRKAK